MNAENKHFPGWNALLDLWVNTHFKEKTCVVFHHPLEYTHYLGKTHFPTDEESVGLINGEYAILVCNDIESALRICNETPDSKPFATVWHLGELVHENT